MVLHKATLSLRLKLKARSSCPDFVRFTYTAYVAARFEKKLGECDELESFEDLAIWVS